MQVNSKKRQWLGHFFDCKRWSGPIRYFLQLRSISWVKKFLICPTKYLVANSHLTKTRPLKLQTLKVLTGKVSAKFWQNLLNFVCGQISVTYVLPKLTDLIIMAYFLLTCLLFLAAELVVRCSNDQDTWFSCAVCTSVQKAKLLS